MCTKFVRMIPLVLILLTLITGIEREAFAQCSANNCNPLNETFGTTAGCNSATSQSATSYTYMQNMTNQPSTSAPNDGSYAIRCNSGPNWQGGWETTASGVTDGSGTTGGNYLVVNAGYTGDTYGAYHPYEFYHRNVTQLCPGAKYDISFKMANLSTYDAGPPSRAPSNCGYASPIEIQSWVMPAGSAVQPAATAVYNGSAGTQIYKTSATDWYCSSSGFQWKTYSGTYTVPAGQTSFDIVLVSGYVRSAGDDFLIDDIQVTYNSGAPAGFSCTPTPVKLISFTAEKAPQNVVLKWSTASEENFSHFVVERSTDGINFQQTGIVYGSGNSGNQIDYTYADNSNSQGLVYYRLKQVDIDGTFKYSVIRSLNIDITSPALIYSSDGDLTIQFNAKGEATYTVVDMLGRILYSGNRTSDETSITVNKSNFSSGVYIVKVQMGTELVTKKLVLN